MIEQDEDDHTDMPWDIVGPLRAWYPGWRADWVSKASPSPSSRLADGRARSSMRRCLAVRRVLRGRPEALLHAKFQPKDVHVRFGASYKMPFVFENLRPRRRATPTGAHACARPWWRRNKPWKTLRQQGGSAALTN